jgi:hypothetical protein
VSAALPLPVDPFAPALVPAPVPVADEGKADPAVPSVVVLRAPPPDAAKLAFAPPLGRPTPIATVPLLGQPVQAGGATTSAQREGRRPDRRAPAPQLPTRSLVDEAGIVPSAPTGGGGAGGSGVAAAMLALFLLFNVPGLAELRLPRSLRSPKSRVDKPLTRPG